MLGLRSARGRAILAGTVLVLLLVAVGAVAVWRARQDQQSLATLDRTSSAATALARAEAGFWQAQGALSAMVISGDPALGDIYDNAFAAAEQNLAEARAQFTAVGEADKVSALDGLTNRIGQFNQGVKPFFPVIIEGDRQLVLELANSSMSEMTTTSTAIIADLQEMVQEAQQDASAEREAAEHSAEVILWLLLGLSGVALATGAGTVVMLVGSVVGPLAALRASARAITSGRPQARAKVSGPEEVASLARDFNDMTDALAAKALALQESEKRYRLLAENASDIIWTMDMNLRYTYESPAVTRIRGYSPEEAMAQTVEETLTPASLEIAKTALAEELAPQAMKTRALSRSRTLELEHTCKDGSTIWLEVTTTFLRDEDGRAVGLLGVSRDISERRRAEEALRQTRDYLEKLIDHANAPIIVWDPSFMITRFNDAFERLTGRPASQVIGQRLEVLFPEPERAASMKKIARTLRGEFWELIEIPILHQSGEVRQVLWNSANITGVDGRTVVATIAQGTDISERKRAEEALQESEARYKALFAGAPVGMLVANAKTKQFRYANPGACSMFGYTEEEFLRMDVTAIHPKESVDQVLAEFEAQARGEKRLSLGLPCLRKDGTLIYADISSIAIVLDGHKCSVGIFTDITERKRADEELRQRNQEISEHLRVKSALSECSSELLKAPTIEAMSDLVLESCLKTTGSAVGFVGYIDRSTGHLVCPTMTREVWDQCDVAGKSVVFEKLGGIVGWPLEHMEAVISNCVRQDPRSRGAPSGHIPIERFLGIPCQYEGKLVGTIGLANKPTDYDQADLDTATQFATLYALAIERRYTDQDLVHASEEARRRNEELGLFLNLSSTLASSMEVDELVETALEGVTKVLPQADVINLGIYDEDGDVLNIRSARGMNLKTRIEMTTKPGEGMTGKVFQSGKSVLYSSPEEVAAAREDMSPKNLKLARQVAQGRNRPQNAICAPLVTEGRVLGSLLAVTSDATAPFQQADLALLEAAASHIAVALDKAQLHAQTEVRAITDGLTGLYDHAHFYHRLAEEIERSQRYNGGFAVAMMDVDNFKHFNDSCGHQQGDEMLRLVADSIRSGLRRSDLAFRYGGDEFAAILLHADAARAQAVIDRINRHLARSLKRMNHDAAARLSVSAGIACFPEEGSTTDELVRIADTALYSAKWAARARYATEQECAIEALAPPPAMAAMEMLSTTAGSLAAALRELGVPDALAELNLRTVAALGTLAEIKDPYIRGHQERTSEVAATLAEKMGLSSDQVRGTRLAGLLHDLGKAGVSKRILNKPGKLTEEEFAEIKEHPPLGSMMIISEIEALQQVVPIVRHHHEHFDGKGYPDGLAGQDIPLEARILAVVDAFDAMTHERSYRKALSREEALAEVKRGTGTQFDPAVVEMFLAWAAEEGEKSPARSQSANKGEELAAVPTTRT